MENQNEQNEQNERLTDDQLTEIRNRPNFVNVYEVTRHCGGSEEGGWFYNWSDCVASIPLTFDARYGSDDELNAEIETIIQFCKLRFVNEGNIYSVLDGVEYHFIAESERAETESKERPHYE